MFYAEAAIAPASLQGVRIRFSETMKGWISAEATTFEDGYARGEAAGHVLALHVTVELDDLAAFLADPGHACALSGHVDCALLGGICPMRSGVFRMLTDGADRHCKIMAYHGHCTTPLGETFTLVGKKEVQHDAPFDLWHDTTTLFVNVFPGHVDPDKPAQARLLATGIIGLGLADFVQVLHGLRATAPDGSASIEGLLRFGQFFFGKLWDVYGPHLPPAAGQPRRRYGRFTNEGVSGAGIVTHSFQTGDGLGLMLTRFRRAPCDDVVLLVHGLTNSTDMFIMPEHRNLVQHLLGEGFGDIWSLDYRGSNRFPYNLERGRYNLDDIALFDHPAAIHEIRRHIGPHRRLHVIAHCVGAITMAMSVAAGTVTGIRSMILNSVALTPMVPRWSQFKLAWGPLVSNLLGIEYLNPAWRRQPGWSVGKLIACAADFMHRECDSPECHMLSFMWGSGQPGVFNHANIADETHARLGDLFGGTAVHYYCHLLKMVKSGNAAVKFEPGNPRYAALPDNYLRRAADIAAPILFVQGQENRVFADSNIRCHEHMQKVAPGRHSLLVSPGYGHQDIFMGKDAAQDIFPHMVEFLRGHCHG